MFGKATKALIASLFVSSTANAQKAYSEDGEVDPKLAMNRATNMHLDLGDEMAIVREPVRSSQAPLLDTFKGTTKKVVGDGIWKERGVATLWYDKDD